MVTGNPGEKGFELYSGGGGGSYLTIILVNFTMQIHLVDVIKTKQS